MTQHWLSLREAADLIGKSKRTDWDFEKCADDAQLMKAIRRKLYNMLGSGTVETYAIDGEHTVRLETKDFLHPFFSIDLEFERVDLPRAPGAKYSLKISHADLKKYLVEAPPGFIGREEMLKLIGHEYTNEGLLNMERRGKFPKRVTLSPSLVVWVREEVHIWLIAKLKARTPDES